MPGSVVTVRNRTTGAEVSHTAVNGEAFSHPECGNNGCCRGGDQQQREVRDIRLGVPGTPYLTHLPDIKMKSDKAIWEKRLN